MNRGFDQNHVAAMTRLCAVADVILPNVTEACLMLDRPYQERQSKAQVEMLLRELAALGSRRVVITGVSLEAGRVGIACWDGGETAFFDRPRTPGHFNGTGDLFASVLTAAFVRGTTFFQAAAQAMAFTSDVIAKTAQNPDHRLYGVDFEPYLRLLFPDQP